MTFGVAGETFRVQLVGEKQIEADAQSKVAVRRGSPMGGSSQASVSTRVSWHSKDVAFVEVAIEVTRRASPHRPGLQFGGGRSCRVRVF